MPSQQTPLAAAVLALLAILPAQSKAPVGGAVPDHEFPALLDHDGRTRLSELYGQPVLIAGFRQHLVEGMHAAWAAHQLLRDHAKAGLIVILEDQRAWNGKGRDRWEDREDHARVQAFWKRLFGTPAWLTTNLSGDDDPDLPIQRQRSKRDVTSLVLIGVDGTLRMEGSAEDPKVKEKRTDDRAAVKRAVLEELARRKKGWGKTPLAKKVRATAFGKGRLAGAHKLLASASEVDPAERTRLTAELDRAFAARQKVIRYLLDTGRPTEAKTRLAALTRSAKRHPAYAGQLGTLDAAMKSPDVRAQLKLDRKLTKLLKPADDRKFARFGFEGILAVRAFAERHKGTPVGARAARMDPFLKHVVSAAKGMRLKDAEARLAELARK